MSAGKPTHGDKRDRTLSPSERSEGSNSSHAPVPLVQRDVKAEDLDLRASSFENLPCGYVVLGINGQIRQANTYFLTLCGRSFESTSQSLFQQLLSPSGAIYYETQFLPVLIMRGSLKEVAFDLLRPSRERVPVLVNATLQRDTEGKPSVISVAVFDAAERRLYERNLLRSRKDAEQMSEVVRRSTDAIVMVTPEGNIQSWNRGAEQMFGYSSTQVVGQPFIGLLFPAEAQKEISGASVTLKEGQDVKKEIVCINKSGKEFDASINLTPHMEAPGILIAYSAIIRDASSRRLAERALLQSEKLASVGQLASSIAHEINNPLEAVTNLLYILEMKVSDPATKSVVRMAQEELARVSHITTQTLRFFRQSTGRTEVDIDTLLKSVLSLYAARLNNSGITVEIGNSDAAPLFCYDGELRQIFANLIGNSFDAMRVRGGRLMLRSRNATRWSTGVRGVRITVADNGTGMDKKTLTKIFEPFFTTKGISGTGLGLWVTQELVDRNLGDIRVRSDNREGSHGTVFSLFFPHAERA